MIIFLDPITEFDFQNNFILELLYVNRINKTIEKALIRI